MSAAKVDETVIHEDPIELRTAIAMLAAGLRPIPIHPGKKRPIGESWGLRQHTEATLRQEWAKNPGAGVGILLGDDGQGGGVIDLEVDDESLAAEVLDRLFPQGIPETLRWRSNLGWHYLFRYDPRLAKYGSTIIKGWLEDGEVKGNERYLGVEFRFGTIDLQKPVQEQSVIPPTLRDDGTPRQWVGEGGTLLLPEAAFDDLSRILPIPESVFRDLDIFATEPLLAKGPEDESWDVEDVKTAILPHAVGLAKGWGLEITGKRATSKGFLTCRAIGRRDNDPSAGFNEKTGVYTDRKYGGGLSIFQLAVALGVYPDFPTAVNELGREYKVPPVSQAKPAKRNFVNSGNNAARFRESPEPEWGWPRYRQSLPAAPFPLEVLPIPLADLCREGAIAMQCPVDYLASAAIGLAGGVIGRSVNLTLKVSWSEQPNLYVAIVGPPGTKKSPAIRLMGHVLAQIDYDLDEAYQVEKLDYDERLRDWEADRKRGQAGPSPTPPSRRQLTMDDATREAVAEVHADNPRSLILIKDELSGWVASLNTYKQGKGDDKQFWLQVNSGSRVKVNRKSGDRKMFVIPRPCISIVGALTPAMLPTIRAGNDDDGWLDRILFSYPEPVVASEWVEAEIDEGLISDWDNAIRKLWSRPMLTDERGRNQPSFVRLRDDAKAIWIEWFNSHCAEKHDPEFPRALMGPWSKLEGFAARLALILSQLHQAYDPDDTGPPRDLTPLDIWGAAKLIDYFKAHFRRARADLTRRPDDVSDEADAVLRWIDRNELTSFTWRDVNRNFPRFDDGQLHTALNWLIARHFIREKAAESRPPGRRGRTPSTTFEVNPSLPKIRSEIDKIAELAGTTEHEDTENGELCNSVNSAACSHGNGDGPSASDIDDAAAWLRGYLVKDSAEIEAAFVAAEKRGINEAALGKAAHRIGVEVIEVEGKEHWKLPY